MTRTFAVALCAMLAACAPQPRPAAASMAGDSLLPGSIGVLMSRGSAGLVVAAAREGAGLRVGDVVLRYNGAALSSVRQFNRLVLDSPPGSAARVELLRDGDRRVIHVPVRELDTMPRA